MLPLTPTSIQIGRLLRASTTGCVIGCQVTQVENLTFGGLVRIPAAPGYQIFGLVYDIHIDDDGLVRQLVTAEHVNEMLIQDNRLNRNIPAEISVLFVGYQRDKRVSHLMPPRPPLSLDQIFTCSAQETLDFTAGSRFGYFRHILGSLDLPVAELLAAHLQQTHAVYLQLNNETWLESAVSELIVLLRDDYETLNRVLGAISEIYQDQAGA
jgi:hypothetical protein